MQARLARAVRDAGYEPRSTDASATEAPAMWMGVRTDFWPIPDRADAVHALVLPMLGDAFGQHGQHQGMQHQPGQDGPSVLWRGFGGQPWGGARRSGGQAAFRSPLVFYLRAMPLFSGPREVTHEDRSCRLYRDPALLTGQVVGLTSSVERSTPGMETWKFQAQNVQHGVPDGFWK